MEHSKYGRTSLHLYLASDDPFFEKKAVEIIDLYTNPMQHAAVFCMYKTKNNHSSTWPPRPVPPMATSIYQVNRCPFIATPRIRPADFSTEIAAERNRITNLCSHAAGDCRRILIRHHRRRTGLGINENLAAMYGIKYLSRAAAEGSRPTDTMDPSRFTAKKNLDSDFSEDVFGCAT